MRGEERRGEEKRGSRGGERRGWCAGGREDEKIGDEERRWQQMRRKIEFVTLLGLRRWSE